MIRTESECEVSKGTATTTKDLQRVGAGLFRSVSLVVLVSIEQDILSVYPDLSETFGVNEGASKTFHQAAIRAIIVTTAWEVFLVGPVGKVDGHRGNEEGLFMPARNEEMRPKETRGGRTKDTRRIDN